MKRKISYILGLSLMIAAVVFNSCEEKDDYDYNAIDPVVETILGSTEVRGGQILTYRTPARGGSTFAFTSEGAIDGLTTVEGEAYSILVDFAESYTDDTAELTVVETTMGGKVSEPYTLEIKVNKLDINIVGDTLFAVVEDNPIERTFTVDFKYPNATYEWTATGDDFEIIEGANADVVKIRFDYPDVDIHTINLAVEVTTRKSNTLTDDMDIHVMQFCPLVIEDLLGDWVGSIATSGGACPQTAVVVAVDEEENTITMEEFTDFLTVCAWGEGWVDVEGLTITLNEPDGTITIPMQYYGQSDYPDYYFIRGVAFEEDADYHGVYNFCQPVMTLKFEILLGEGVDADGNPVDGDGEPVDIDDLWNPFGVALTSSFTFAPDGKSIQLLNVPDKK